MEIRKLNYRAGWLIADYLNETPRAITPELLRSVLPDGADPATEEYVYAALLAGFLGLDTEASEEDRFIEANYLRPGLQRLDTALYKNDPYYRNIRIPGIDGLVDRHMRSARSSMERSKQNSYFTREGKQYVLQKMWNR